MKNGNFSKERETGYDKVHDNVTTVLFSSVTETDSSTDEGWKSGMTLNFHIITILDILL